MWASLKNAPTLVINVRVSQKGEEDVADEFEIMDSTSPSCRSPEQGGGYGLLPVFDRDALLLTRDPQIRVGFNQNRAGS